MKSQRAIAFTEIIVSLLLLGIAIGAILGAFVIGSASAAREKHRISAVNIARQKIENIKGTAYSQIMTQAGTENVDIDGSPGQLITTILDVYGNSKMYKVTVVVQWTGHKSAGVLQERAITLISQH